MVAVVSVNADKIVALTGYVNTPILQIMKPQQLIKRYGSQYAVAKAFGVTRAAVQQWVKAGKVPDARLWQLQAGKVAKP